MALLGTKKDPKDEILGQTKVQGLVEVAAKRNVPALLIGETGTGKTSIIRSLANDMEQPWRRFNLTGETTVDEFVGKFELKASRTVWQDGILLQAMKNGEWLIVDEVNVALPEILFVLHSLLDDDKFVVVPQNRGETVRPHPNFRLFATMNPVDEYAGTKELNKAFLSRFNIVINVDYPTPSFEQKILRNRTGISKQDALKLVDVGNAVRKLKRDSKVFYTMSTRDLIQWASLIDELGIKDAFTVAVLNKATNDRKEIVKAYDQIVGRYGAFEDKEIKLSIEWFENKQAELDKQEKEIKQRIKKGVDAIVDQETR